jgi:hypothetical protein
MVSRARRVVLSLVTSLSLIAGACGDSPSNAGDGDGDGDADAGTPDAGLPERRVRGRVTDVTGKAVADVPVVVEGEMVQTDAEGRFDVKVRTDEAEVQVAVDSKSYSSGTMPVKVAGGADSHVEVSVKSRQSVMATVASDGVSAEKDGVIVKVPADGLRTKSGEEVSGEVEVAVTVVKDPADVTAAPGRLESDDRQSLEGYGFAEVRFFQNDAELVLTKVAHFEIPLSAEIATENGEKVVAYGLGTSDKRWKSAGEATVMDGKLVIETDQAAWLGGARALPIDSCVSGRLLAGGSAALNTTIRAARGRGLSLVQADTGTDGSFCVPVTPNDDWQVSTYYDDGAAGLGLSIPLNSSDATGMCGGDGCKQVGDVDLPALTPP